MSDLDTATYIRFENNKKDNHHLDRKYNDKSDDSDERRKSNDKKKNIKMHASNLKYFLHELYSYYYLGVFNPENPKYLKRDCATLSLLFIKHTDRNIYLYEITNTVFPFSHVH